jgi:DNA primase
MIDVRAILNQLEIDQVRESNDEIICRCPFHDDQRPSFSINTKTGKWICFAGCGAGSIESLLERFGIETDFSTSDDVLANWRGFSPETVRHWKMEYVADLEAVRIPVHDLSGRVVSHLYRKLGNSTIKYLYEKGFKKSEVLFGLYESQRDYGLDAVRSGIVIVEGPLDAIWVHSTGFPACAILGGTMSKAQREILLTQGVKRVILALDNDEVGQKENYRLRKIFREAGLWVKMLQLPKDKKDVQEVAIDELQKLLNDRTVYSTKIPAFLKRWY